MIPQLLNAVALAAAISASASAPNVLNYSVAVSSGGHYCDLLEYVAAVEKIRDGFDMERNREVADECREAILEYVRAPKANDECETYRAKMDASDGSLWVCR